MSKENETPSVQYGDRGEIAANPQRVRKKMIKVKPRTSGSQSGTKYQVRASTTGTGPALPIVDSTQARSIVLGNLTPGTTCTVQARAMGSSEGYSEWSGPVSHMAM